MNLQGSCYCAWSLDFWGCLLGRLLISGCYKLQHSSRIWLSTRGLISYVEALIFTSLILQAVQICWS
ncbi:hypothetical protein NL676_004125 [Syzygium grande]|nr:hypothetical protein NL676_004125 [Syzygium grande]